MKITGKTAAIFAFVAMAAYAVLVIPQVQYYGTIAVALALGYFAAKRWG